MTTFLLTNSPQVPDTARRVKVRRRTPSPARAASIGDTTVVAVETMSAENRAIYEARLAAVTARITAELERLGLNADRERAPAPAYVDYACDWCGQVRRVRATRYRDRTNESVSGKLFCGPSCAARSRHARNACQTRLQARRHAC